MKLYSETPLDRTIEGQVYRFAHYLDFTKAGSTYEVFMGVDTGELRMFLTRKERAKVSSSNNGVARRINVA